MGQVRLRYKLDWVSLFPIMLLFRSIRLTDEVRAGIVRLLSVLDAYHIKLIFFLSSETK